MAFFQIVDGWPVSVPQSQWSRLLHPKRTQHSLRGFREDVTKRTQVHKGGLPVTRMLVIEGDTAYEPNGSITIRTAIGRELIDAAIRDHLAIHPDGFDTVHGLMVTRFAVTHIRSGLQLLTVHGYYPAVVAVDSLQRSGIVWGVACENLPLDSVRMAVADAKADAVRYLKNLDKCAV